MWWCRHGLTHHQMWATRSRRRATMWSLQAWAAGEHFASHGAQCHQGQDVQLTICFCCSLLGPGSRPSRFFCLLLLHLLWLFLSPSFLKYVSKGFCFSECFCLHKEQQGTVALSAYLPKSRLQAVCCSTPTYGAKLMLNYLFLIPFD